MVLQVGQQLQGGIYTIESKLREGQFAITYLARRSDGERRIIKVLDPEALQVLETKKKGTQQRLEDQFWIEALALSKCEGLPHVIQMDEPFRDNGIICLPMEYMNGNSLAELPQLRLSEKLAIRYIRQISESLIVVHQKKLVHCNIKPKNIFLRAPDGEQEAVLANFRLVVTFDTPWATTQNVTGTAVDNFSAPELYTLDRPIGSYTDVYSLSATLYYLVTGEAPIEAKYRQKSRDPLQSPQVKNPNLSPDTTKAILKGLAIDLAERPNTVGDWLYILPGNTQQLKPVQQKEEWSLQATIGVIMAGIALMTLIVQFIGVIPAWLLHFRSPSIPNPTITEKSLGSTK